MATGTYIADADIENVFGVTNVARWSNLESGTSKNDTRMAAAITYAEAWVVARLRGRFSLPLSGDGLPLVKGWMARIAGVWLYESRGLRDSRQDEEANRVRFHEREVNGQIDQFLAGQLRLGLSENQTRPTAPVVVRHG